MNKRGYGRVGLLLAFLAMFAWSPLTATAGEKDQAKDKKKLKMETMVVTATRSEEAKDELPQQVDVIGPQEIQETQAADLTDLLKKDSSVDVIQYPGALSGVSIRGFRPEFSGITKHYLLLIDGRPAGTTNLAAIPKDIIARVEVLKGPASSLYGGQAMGGVMSLTGHEGSPPTRVGASIGDIAAGLYTAIGVSAALYHRRRTGRGMLVDVAMLDCQTAILENAIARCLAEGRPPGPLGARHPSITPFDAFAAADGYLVIAAGNDALFAKLCAALDRPDLAVDPRFADNDLRTRHQDQLRAEMEKTLAERGRDRWLETLGRAGIPCGPINDVAQVLNDPQTAARNMIISAAGEGEGGLKMAGNPVKLSAFDDPSTRPPAPELDQHRAEILADLDETEE